MFSSHLPLFVFLLHRKPELEPLLPSLLPSLLSLLSSPRANDTISEELVDMLGFDNIEVSMQLLEDRQNAVQELSLYLNGSQQYDQPTPVYGIGRGKQRAGRVLRRMATYMSIESLHSLRTTDASSLSQILNPDEARRRMEETFRANAERPLFTGTAVSNSVCRRRLS